MNFNFNKQKEKLILTKGNKKEWICVADIKRITVDDTLATIYVEGQENSFSFIRTLASFEAELLDYGFFKVNRNTLVDGAFIKHTEEKDKKHIILLKSGEKFEFSQRQYKKFRKIINTYA